MRVLSGWTEEAGEQGGGGAGEQREMRVTLKPTRLASARAYPEAELGRIGIRDNISTKEGVFVGMSSGAAVAGALRLEEFVYLDLDRRKYGLEDQTMSANVGQALRIGIRSIAEQFGDLVAEVHVPEDFAQGLSASRLHSKGRPGM